MHADEWGGKVGETWAREWERTDRSFKKLDAPLEQAILDAVGKLPIAPAAATLVDLGCGAGATSLAVAAALPDAVVTGLDLSSDLLGVAAKRRDELGIAADGCRFLQGDAVGAAAPLAPVDLFFSRHGVMFFDDPIAAFTRLGGFAAPRGWLVFSCFAAVTENSWASETLPPQPLHSAADRAEPGPFAFADPDYVAAIMSAAGWKASPPQKVRYRYVVGAGDDPVDDAVTFFQRIGPTARALRMASDADRSSLTIRIHDACTSHLADGEVAFAATAWLWSAHRQEPAR